MRETDAKADPARCAEARARGRELHKAGRLLPAIEAYAEAVASDNSDPELFHEFGRLLLDYGSLSEAAAAFDKCRRMDSGHARAAGGHGLALQGLGRFPEAIAALTFAIDKDPDQAGLAANLGDMLAKRGNREGAVAAYDHVPETSPNFAAAIANAGHWLRMMDRPEEAKARYERAIAADPEDRAGARLGLALIAGDRPDGMPRAYVEKLFDEYADNFDTELVAKLKYSVPATMAEIVGPLLSADSAVLDLGCGTGLCAEPLVGRAGRIDGVDLAQAMIDKARGKGIYRDLFTADILDALRGAGRKYDAMIAGDALVYLGDLEPVLRAAEGRLASGGHFAFSIEIEAGASFRLGPRMRFIYGEEYVPAVAKRLSWRPLEQRRIVARVDGGERVPAMLYLLRRRE